MARPIIGGGGLPPSTPLPLDVGRLLLFRKMPTEGEITVDEAVLSLDELGGRLYSSCEGVIAGFNVALCLSRDALESD